PGNFERLKMDLKTLEVLTILMAVTDENLRRSVQHRPLPTCLGLKVGRKPPPVQSQLAGEDLEHWVIARDALGVVEDSERPARYGGRKVGLRRLGDKESVFRLASLLREST